MAPSSPFRLDFDGSTVDGSWFTAVTDFARHTAWLNAPAEAWTQYGLGVFAVLMIVGWWQARRADAATMTAALVAPVCVLVAFVVAEVVKSGVAELRPCRSLPNAFIVEACPALDDYAFPSGHSTVAAATVAALYLVSRRLCAIAALFALAEGASRVYVGAHYPHDVAGSFVVGLLVALAASVVLRRVASGYVETLRTGRLRPLLAVS